MVADERWYFMKEKLQRFMWGRYGNDRFNQFLMIVALVCLALSFFGLRIFYVLALALLVYAYYRMFSKDLSKRSAENQWYLKKEMKVRGWWQRKKKAIAGRKENKIYKCPCRCVAHPLEKHPTRRNLFTDYVADMTVLFSCYKAEDDWEDEHSLKGLVYSYLLGRKFRKKPLLYQEKVRTISLAMQDFADAEKQGNADIDTMAGLFGRVMAQIVSCREDEWKDNLERLGFFLGKFIYLLDAYEDIEQDLKKGTYNPLKKRYEEPGFEEDCRQILTMMMSECCKEFEQLPILQNVDILRNILYSGVWCRYEIVRKKRMKDSAKEVTGNDL